MASLIVVVLMVGGLVLFYVVFGKDILKEIISPLSQEPLSRVDTRTDKERWVDYQTELLNDWEERFFRQTGLASYTYPIRDFTPKRFDDGYGGYDKYQALGGFPLSTVAERIEQKTVQLTNVPEFKHFCNQDVVCQDITEQYVRGMITFKEMYDASMKRWRDAENDRYLMDLPPSYYLRHGEQEGTDRTTRL